MQHDSRQKYCSSKCQLGFNRRKWARGKGRESRKVSSLKYAQSETSREVYLQTQRATKHKYRQKPENKVKEQARFAVHYAIRKGILTREPCVNCGSIISVQGHHHKGYGEEFWLDVIWLCRSCHQD